MPTSLGHFQSPAKGRFWIRNDGVDVGVLSAPPVKASREDPTGLHDAYEQSLLSETDATNAC